MKRGHPPVFTEEQAKHVAELVRVYKVGKVRAILAEPTSPLRSMDIFPDATSVSEPTIAKAAKKYGVELRRGRPLKKAA